MPVLKKIALGASLLWLVLFAVLTTAFIRTANRLSAQSDLLSENSTALTQKAFLTRDLIDRTRAQTTELGFFQSILDYIPSSDAAVRAQKALMDDVQALRRKVGHRLRGRVHILVDTKANILYLKEGAVVLLKADCSAGRGGVFTDKNTGRRWEFVTPRGKFRVLDKVKNPIWIKPDWAFVEEGLPPPPPNDPSRRAEGELGAYLLSLGDGYLIHGTQREELLGRPASHGCVRVGAVNLAILYEKVPVGTEVFIY